MKPEADPVVAGPEFAGTPGGAAPLLKLVPIRKKEEGVPSDVPPLVQAVRRGRAFLDLHRLFIGMVVAPVMVATFYFLVLAADRYAAEARYVIRNPGLGSAPTIGALIAPGTLTRTLDDVHAINAFILSHDALSSLRRRLDMDAILGRAGHDPWWMFPAPWGSSSTEAMLDQYKRLVSVELDKTTGITTLEVQAFTPEDAVLVAGHLLDDAERMVNQLSARARADILTAAANELEAAKNRLTEAQNRLTEYRNRERVIDPTRVSNAVAETMARLALEIAQTNAQLFELRGAAEQSPQIATLRNRIAALEAQMDRERAQLAGSDSALAQKIADYEKLLLEKGFAERLVTSAANSAEAARLDVQRQQLYLERVVSPALPDWPDAPYRLLSILAVAVASYLGFALVRNIRSHAG